MLYFFRPMALSKKKWNKIKKEPRPHLFTAKKKQEKKNHKLYFTLFSIIGGIHHFYYMRRRPYSYEPAIPFRIFFLLSSFLLFFFAL